MSNETERRIHLQEFKKISKAILMYRDVNLLVNHVVKHICKSFCVTGCSIMLYDERAGQLFRVASHGVSEEYLNKGPLMVDDQYTAFVTGEPIFVEDFASDDRVKYPEEAAKEGLSSMLSVPIKYRGAPVGLVRIYNAEHWRLDDEDLESFCLIALQLGLVIENNGLVNFFEKVKGAMELLPPRLLEGLEGP